MSILNALIYFDYNQKSATLFIFFFNMVVFAAIFLKKGFIDHHQESKWLGLFVLLCALYICPFMLGYAGWYGIQAYREFLFFIPFQQLFLIGPVIYFYTLSLLHVNFQLSKKHLIHFLPAALYMVYSLIIFITDKVVLDQFYFYADGRDKDLAFWYQMAGLLSMLYYLILSIIRYRQYRKAIVQEASFADEVLFKWINHFIIAFVTILVLRLLFFILNPEWADFGTKYWYYLCFSLLTFYISIAGYKHLITSSMFRFSQGVLLSGLGDVQSDIHEAGQPELDNLAEWKSKLVHLVENEKIYTNPELTLTVVAEQLGTNRNVVSVIINQGFDMNFNDYINLKRVEAVIDQIKAGKHEQRSLLAIAFDTGFNSKSTFNRAFKKHTSLTPKQYVANNLN